MSNELRRQVSITTCTSTGAMGGDVHMHGGHAFIMQEDKKVFEVQVSVTLVSHERSRQEREVKERRTYHHVRKWVEITACI